MNQSHKIVVTTQALENYGFEEGRDYWKAKVGSDYVVLTNEDFTGVAILDSIMIETANEFIEGVLPDNEMYREYVIDTQIVNTSKPCYYEESQMEYEGRVTYFDKVFVMNRDFTTGVRSFREATDAEVAAYRAQLRFPITEEA